MEAFDHFLGFLFLFFTLVTSPSRSVSLKLSGTRVYEPHIRARLGTTVFFRFPALNVFDGNVEDAGEYLVVLFNDDVRYPGLC